jgi:ATP-dependent RNA helicase RhlE
MTFEELGLIAPILKALQAEGYVNPTPIQQQSIPSILEGRDLLGCAQTGTGKTAAFSLPIIQHLYHNRVRKQLSTLILTPTRELAIQIGESFTAYGKHTGINHTVIFGGVSQVPQVNILKQGIEVLIATPGRLLDLMQQGFISLSTINLFVLDEADRMLDMGFAPDVKRIISHLPKQRQSLFFSATMPPEIVKLANTILNNPVKVEVTPVSSTAETVQQQLYYIDKLNKKLLLMDLLKGKDMKSVLVFARTKHGADRIARDLTKKGFKTAAIHGDKSQNARQNCY